MEMQEYAFQMLPYPLPRVASKFLAPARFSRVGLLLAILIAPGVSPGVASVDVLQTERGVRLSWPTESGRIYQAQWASEATGPWINLGGERPGDGGVSTLDDFSGGGVHYRVVEEIPGSTEGISVVVNGGFEAGAGASADGWQRLGGQAPERSNLQSRSGGHSIRARLLNATATPNEGLLVQRLSEAGAAVQPGRVYDFIFYARQVSVGASYLQQYELQWLSSTGLVLGGTGLINFTAPAGSWQEFRIANLTAPANATDAIIRFRFVTGAVQGGEGEVFIDDVSLATEGVPTPPQTLYLEPARDSILEVSWLSRAGVPYQPLVSSTLGDLEAWMPHGAIISGNGAVRSLVLPLSASPLFFKLSYPGDSGDPGDPGGPSEPLDYVPLFDTSTPLEPEIVVETPTALVTYFGDRARDRHAREFMFRAYDHYLPWYWEERTFVMEITDRVAKGGNDITFTYTTLIPLSQPEFRAFYRGQSTLAEYHLNVLAPLVGPNRYSVTISQNIPEGNRPLAIGDRIEIEISLFLQGPTNGRTNYYGTTFLYIVGTGIVPWQGVGPRLDSFPIPESAWLGGRTTLPYQYSDEPVHLFKQMAGNIAPASTQPFLLGRRLHHTDFGSGVHSEPGNPVFTDHIGKLGRLFNARSCVECHVNNGRSFLPPIGQPLLLGTVNVAADATGTPHPVLGRVFHNQATSGAPDGTARLASYTYIDGQYGDGTPYQLRRPNYSFEGTVPTYYSVRMARPLIGLGLLEAVDEETILALADPDDASGDGISGRPQWVADSETGETRLGRFGHKARMPSLRQQIASAFINDMGVTTTIYSGGQPPELTDEELDQLTRYIAVLGVQAQRNLDSPQVILGHQIFEQAGCVMCHVREMRTGPNHPAAELRNQTIRPYTDLLLHDLGPDMADNLGEGVASGSEWRTPPLWNIGLTAEVGGREAYLHDGRARSLEEAILWHGGEAESAREHFRNLPASDRAALVEYLRSL
jgi:CxxC motif-containing protein (DUF1111 family)